MRKLLLWRKFRQVLPIQRRPLSHCNHCTWLGTWWYGQTKIIADIIFFLQDIYTQDNHYAINNTKVACHLQRIQTGNLSCIIFLSILSLYGAWVSLSINSFLWSSGTSSRNDGSLNRNSAVKTKLYNYFSVMIYN